MEKLKNETGVSLRPGVALFWALGIIVILSSLQGFIRHPDLLGVLGILAGIVIIPPVQDRIKALPRIYEYAIAAIFAVLLVMVVIALFQK